MDTYEKGDHEMLSCVEFKEVENDIIQMMRRKSLIPVIGAGFTKNCASRSGKVPSGDDYLKYI